MVKMNVWHLAAMPIHLDAVQMFCTVFSTIFIVITVVFAIAIPVWLC